MSPNFRSSLLLFSLYSQTCLSSTVTLSVSPSTPQHASSPVDPSFPGFAFEQASFYNYSFDGAGNPNQFSQNLIASVLSRTGGTPVLRVGGTSGDASEYNPAQKYALNYPATNTGPLTGGGLVLGPSYFTAFKNFPNAKYIVMVPMMNRNLTLATLWTEQALANVGNRLEAIELGNEPDLYPWYNLDEYVSVYNQFVTTLSSKISQLKGQVIFQAMDTSSGSKSTLNVPAVLDAGLNKTKQVKELAHHLYQGNNYDDGIEGLQSRIANHTAIVAGVSSFCYGIDYLKQNLPRVPYVLSEDGNTLGYNSSDQRNNLATALWNVDFQLYSMSVNVSRVNMQQILQPGYGMWEPVHSAYGPPMVRANFYSQPFVADFIGLNQSTRVVNLPISGSDTLSAYAAYVNGALARIALVNLDLWDGSGTRPTQQFVIKQISKSCTSARVESLTAPSGAYANDTLTWAGSSWTFQSQGRETSSKQQSTTAKVSNGQLSISVPATSAMMLNFS